MKKYKYTVQFRKHSRADKPTSNISWEDLVNIVHERGPLGIKAIRFHHPGSPNGTEHLDGGEILFLWQAVNRLRTPSI